MTQVLLAVVVVLTVLLVALAGFVVRLRGEVRRLAGDLAEVRGLPAEEPRRSRHARPPMERSRQARPPARLPTENVVVITELSEESPELADVSPARIASVTFGRPLIKAAAFGYGVRRALGEEHRVRMTLAFRQELRRQRKLRRRSARAAPIPGSGP